MAVRHAGDDLRSRRRRESEQRHTLPRTSTAHRACTHAHHSASLKCSSEAGAITQLTSGTYTASGIIPADSLFVLVCVWLRGCACVQRLLHGTNSLRHHP